MSRAYTGLVATMLLLPATTAYGHGGGGGGFHGGGGGFHGGGGFGGGGFHGGGGFGGYHPGGFGGYHPGGYGGYHMASPSFNRTPSFSTPRAVEPAHVGGYRPGNAGNFNRPANFGEFNRAGNVGSFNRVGNINNFNRVTNVNNFNRNVGVNRAGWGGYNPYWGNHAGWYHGWWNGNYGGYGWRPWGYGWGGGGWGWGGMGYGLGTGLGLGMGMGMGYGLSSWLFGPTLYNWGYSSYSNPYYYGGVANQPVIYNYAQPIDTTAQAPEQATTSQATSTLEQARASFQAGDYAQALASADAALGLTPNDPTLHEFRALCLFALGRYDEAAGALYAVLSVGPGWDWTTMISLYGDPGAYTEQLRALEGYCRQNPQSPGARFVLAYHYLTEGHAEEAVGQFREVLALQPKDQVAAKIVEQLVPVAQTGGQAGEPGAPPAPTEPAATAAQDPALAGKLEGSWVANPTNDVAITLGFPAAGKFTWKVTRQGKDQQFEGTAAFESNVLTLVQSANQSNVMVANVIWKDPTHFQFKILGAGPSDPGLSFAKSQ